MGYRNVSTNAPSTHPQQHCRMQTSHTLSSRAQGPWGSQARRNTPNRDLKQPLAQQLHKRVTRAAWSGAAGLTCNSCPHSQQEQQQCTCGIVIVDHGSRRKASNDMLVEFCQLYQQITQQPVVEPAHMEIAEPTIAQAIGRCVEAGAKRVVVAPYFLSKGRHIQDDIPALVAAAREQFPDVACSIADPIGIEPLMVKIIQQRVQAALEKDCPATSASQVAETVVAAAAAAAAVKQ